MMQPPLQLSVPRAVRGSEINLPSHLLPPPSPFNPRNATSNMSAFIACEPPPTGWKYATCTISWPIEWLGNCPTTFGSLFFLRPSENMSTSKGLGVSPSVRCCLVSKMNPSIDTAIFLLSWPPIEPHGGSQDMWRMQRAVCVDVAVHGGTVSVGSSRTTVR
jgi:hypothetical protein